MATTLSPVKQNPEKLIWLFLLGWTLLNAVQAATLGLHSDEAYYWLYSRFLDWGYYDHPPMVAVFIRIGYSLFANEFGLRLITILSSTVALRVLWLTIRNYNPDARWFILVAGGTFIFHIYGFITTPDAPLFFFTILFYYCFQRYLKEDKWQTAILLAIILACLLYSKYHAVLLIGFTVAANIKLLKRGTFWLIPAITATLYIPHIYWQISHGYPSVNYHLFERSSEVYDFAHTYLFIPGQLLMAGPLIGWLFFYLLGRVKIKDAFIRTLLVNCVGTLIFFLINTLKGNVQPHWTLIAFAPLAMLVLIYFNQKPAIPAWYQKLAVANLVFIILIRLLLISNLPFVTKLGAVKSFYNYDKWARKIKQKAGDAYVIFPNSFQDPSKYSFYTHTIKGFSYDSRFYRRTQFDIWPLEDSLQNKRTFYLETRPSIKLKTDSVFTPQGKFYLVQIDSTRTYQRIKIESDQYKVSAAPGQQHVFHLKVTNPTERAVDFSNKNKLHELVLGACFMQDDAQPFAQRADTSFYSIKLQPHQSANYTFTVKTPPQKGHYDLIFSLRTTPFQGGHNSRIINFTVE